MIPMEMTWDGEGHSLKVIEEPKTLSNIETEQQRFNICFEHAYWHTGQLIERRIISAANRYKLIDGNDLIIPCVRHYSKEHHHILDALKDKIVSRQVYDKDQGFIDQFSNYWTREEAMIIATRADQVRANRVGPKDELFSEDLY